MKNNQSVWRFVVLAILVLASARVNASTAPPEKKFSCAEALAIANWSRREKKTSEVTEKIAADLFNVKNPQNKIYSETEVKALINFKTGIDPAPKPKEFWEGLKIRQDFQDVVASEDPSISPAKKADDLAGASLGYVHDYKGGHDSWNIKGALLYPIPLYKIDPKDKKWDSLTLNSVFFTPSISIDKFAAKEEDKRVDSLIFRGGFSGDWSGSNGDLVYGDQLRGYLSYATDTSFDISTLAAEFDWEPRLAQPGVPSLGYRDGFFERKSSADTSKDEWTKSAKIEDHYDLVYTFRTYLHGETGNVSRTKNNTDVEKGGFIRMGPVVKLTVEPCAFSRMLGKDGDAISANISYSYIPDLGGSDLGRDDLFSAGIDYSLFPSTSDRKTTLKLLYQNGGLDLTKQRVNTLTLGLGVTF